MHVADAGSMVTTRGFARASAGRRATATVNFILYGSIEQLLRVRDKRTKLQRETDDEFSGK